MSASETVGSTATSCSMCGSVIAPSLLACPGCRRLVHAERAKALIARATAAATLEDRGAELEALQSALVLLPVDSRQYASVSQRIESLSSDADRTPIVTPAAPQSRFWKWIVGLGPVGVLALKLKFLVVAALAHGKLLLLGLTKVTTFLSMLVAFGVYWTAWGVWFAAGFIASIYIHEMGHVVALRRYGIAASAPMFVPGLGAFIRLRQRVLPPFENARVGLAGPLWGAGAAATAWTVSKAGGNPMWAAIAHTGAWVNLFNLLPVWQLDGNRGFSALGRFPRWTIAGAFAGAWSATGDGLLALLTIAAAVRALDPTSPEQTDTGVWLEFLAIVAALALVVIASAPAAK